MSVIPPAGLSLDSSLSASGLGSSTVPPIGPVNEPASIRNGTPAAKQAYQVGLSFEQMLVSQLTQELASTATDTGDDSSDSGDGSSDSGASGLMGSDPASSAYASMLPQTMTSSIMSGGGTGIAMQIAQSLDPTLAYSQAATPTSTAPTVQTDPTGQSAATSRTDPSSGAQL
jgi:Rod binding domain-containing protein